MITFEKLSVVQTEIHIFIHRIFYVIFNIPIPYAPSMVNGVQVEFVVIGVIVTDVYVYTLFDYKLLKYKKKNVRIRFGKYITAITMQMTLFSFPVLHVDLSRTKRAMKNN